MNLIHYSFNVENGFNVNQIKKVIIKGTRSFIHKSILLLIRIIKFIYRYIKSF